MKINMPEPPNSKEDELRYRVHYLRQDSRSFNFFAGIFIIIFILLITADYALWKDGWVFYGLVAVRISVIGIALAAISRSWKATIPAALDRWAFAFGMYLALTNILVILSRPTGYLHSMMGELGAVVALFATLPDRTLYRVLPPITLSIGSVVCFFIVKEPLGFVASLTVALTFLIANILGIRISGTYYNFRRSSFFAAEKIDFLYKTTSESEKQYQVLVQNSHGIIYTLDPTGIFGFVSPSWTKLLGHDTADVAGRNFRNFVHTDDIAACEAFMRRTVETGEVLQGAVYRVLHSDGSYRWHRSNIVPCFNDKNEIISFVGNAVDITEHVNYETQLKQARILADAASQTKSEFLALVSHEIRTPLSAIVGFSSLASKNTIPGKQKQYLHIIEQSSEALMELVNDILDMSKIEAKQLTLEKIPLNLHQMIQSIEQQFQPQTNLKNIGLRITLDKEVPVWVNSDPIRLRQILTNLLGNAIKFTEAGEVTCMISVINKPGEDASLHVRFEVKDTGIGIPEDKQPLLFESFRQLDASITRKYGGTGMGLAIVRRLVMMMGGKITVTSTERAGSTFIVELPLQAIAEPQAISKPEVSASNIPLSMLVVDDNKTNRILMHDTLTTLGHRITLAVDGNEALEHVASEPFNVILMDLRMPGMDGIEVTRRIRTLEKDAGRARTPVIIVTADTNVQTRETCMIAGIDAVLTKPAPLPKLIATIAEQTTGITVIIQGKTAPDDDMPLLTLQTLADMGHDIRRIKEFTNILLTDVKEEMSNLKAALQTHDRQALEQAAHTLKGLCAHLQNPRLKDLAMHLQAEAKSEALPELHASADLLQSTIDSIITGRRQQEEL